MMKRIQNTNWHFICRIGKNSKLLQITIGFLSGHGLITAIVLADLLAFSPVPKMKRQFVFPILFAMTWFLFSYIYYASGGTGLILHDPERIGKHYLYKARA